ncbi:MAG: S41 family peptidase [Prevotellaceae bacterium]|jgi:carboxyl-terminal processing protease|nr:S41 family peptidase [Prevotellaceae bacterium]
MEKKKNKYLGPLLSLTMVLLALLTGLQLGKMKGRRIVFADTEDNNLSAVMGYVSKYYVDRIDIDSLSDKFIPEILKELDPHSIYIPASELMRSDEPLEGNFEGIGITFNMFNDTVVVVSVIAGGPSSASGVNVGDRIISVNDSTVAGKRIARDSLVSLLRGKSGSKVQIRVKRSGFADLLPLEITRGKIPIKSIDVAYMITPTTGYLGINKFSKTTYQEFVVAIKELSSRGMSGIILDLRDNPGGFLEQAVAVAGELFAEKRLIVYAEGQTVPRENRYSPGNGKCGKTKIAVLINEHSASASEIIAGAIQDNDRGFVVGQRSFGKGLVQQMFLLPDNAGLRLTTARYYMPSGRSLQRKYEHGTRAMENYYGELRRRHESGEHQNADSIKHADTTKYYTCGGRVVYGGGGITPDIFVPSKFDIEMKRMEDLAYGYAFAFGDKHREELNRINTLGDLEGFFERHDPYPEFLAYLQANPSGLSAEKIRLSKKFSEQALKSFVAMQTPLEETGSAFFKNRDDETVRAALKAIESNDTGGKDSV